MRTDAAYAAILARCLRLEAECARLRGSRTRVAEADVAQWRAMRTQGMTIRDIATETGRAKSTVGRYVGATG